ncbi:hypothetical protein BXZ70DRAFT_617477 [Cristinia sonorae]|uniref:Uncharacterized protein n=1 Tax=Cristinia sonorae TaxID=1940300 RepID=A0A8K0UUR2_9AGAR|nr:hypothetical protein BXZ70DRAFT_617477 [Cristinia sonorae]
MSQFIQQHAAAFTQPVKRRSQDSASKSNRHSPYASPSTSHSRRRSTQYHVPSHPSPLKDHSIAREASSSASTTEIPSLVQNTSASRTSLHRDNDDDDDTSAFANTSHSSVDTNASSMDELEEAIDKIIMFVDAQPEEFLDVMDRRALYAVKHALFSKAVGIPFEAGR